MEAGDMPASCVVRASIWASKSRVQKENDDDAPAEENDLRSSRGFSFKRGETPFSHKTERKTYYKSQYDIIILAW